MQPPALLTVPPEIRLQIYHHLFQGATVRANAFHYPQEDGSLGHISLQPASPLLNILLSCRTIHNDATTSFYNLTRFKFERHSIDEINWSPHEISSCFPDYRPLTGPQKLFSTRNLVRHIHYAGNDASFIRTVADIFPNLELLEFDLNWDHLGNDQTNFDRAMKHAMRNREWRHAIKDALEQRFPDGMTRSVWDLQKMVRRSEAGSDEAEGRRNGERRFRVVLLWKLAYRFVEFEGECDFDEWVLRVRDPEGTSKNVYEIRQDPLFFEME
ncbi:hypothetical protein H2198_002709 [Neophaeococcomyces mojaviensis]|uniref:Uncharacterized protein n=1 Tax=Neophaeococcomyces mojaviensis TaxID=3383035 RepID=A0ACC3ADF5_9EURO|nr:hypothetical protein H2198_002709 [Knufia sp. JES_112]